MNLNIFIDALKFFGLMGTHSDHHKLTKNFLFKIGKIDPQGRFLNKICLSGLVCAALEKVQL